MEQLTVTVMCSGIGGILTFLSTSVTTLSQFLHSAGSLLDTVTKSKYWVCFVYILELYNHILFMLTVFSYFTFYGFNLTSMLCKLFTYWYYVYYCTSISYFYSLQLWRGLLCHLDDTIKQWCPFT